MSRSIALWACLAVLLLPPMTAGAGGTEEEAGGWKVLALDGSYVDSECIGSNETPECYGDTMLACGMWYHPELAFPAGWYRLQALCNKHELFHDGFFFYGHDFSPYKTWVFYRLDIWTLREADIPWPGGWPYKTWRPGDTVVDFQVAYCFDQPGGEACLEPRRADPGWQPSDGCPTGAVCEGWAFQNSGRLSGYRPALILRHSSRGWRLVSPYKEALFGSDASWEWHPDHWKAK